MKLASLIAVAGIAAAAAAQGTMTYSWTCEDVGGNNDGAVDPGETVVVSLWASMDPGATGFAGSIYDIVGTSNWDTGTVTSYTNLIDSLGTGPGDLQANNDILGIEALQLPPLFNPNFNADNPVRLYEIAWTPNDYTARTVSLGDTNHLNNDVFVDDFGTSVGYTGVPGSCSFNIVPAPASLALVGLGGLVAGRRRR